MEPDELTDLLRRSHARRDEELRSRWSRSLPFGDAFGDRWGRARTLGFGDGSSVYDSAIVFGDVVVGTGVWIGPQVLLDGSGGRLEIGDSCDLSAGVQVYTHDTVRRALSGGRLPMRTGQVHIGARCHLGAGAIVLSGVHIGDECVIGANSLINRDVPDRTIVAGSPARAIGRVEIEGDEIALRYDAR